MIRKLQRKFIMIAGLAVIILMVCFLLPVNLINRIRVGNELRHTIRFIMEADGDLSDVKETEGERAFWPRALMSLMGSAGSLNLTQESQYQLRYFLVTMDQDGAVTDVSLSHIASIDRGEAEAFAKKAFSRYASSGVLHSDRSSYYYLRDRLSNRGTLIGFLDCTGEMNSLSIFMFISIGFALLLITVFLIIIVILSKRAMKPYIDNMESQREFITNAGHELKTPLAIISANAEVIEMMNGKSEWTDSILSQVKRGTSLINDLIILSRTTESEQVILTDVDVSNTVMESARAFRPVIEKEGKKLTVQVQEDIRLKSEQAMLTELCNILVDNAGKYCDEGGTVDVTLKRKGRAHALLQVSNNYEGGAGVDYSRFFGRFYRGDTSHNSRKSGYGIGLSMAQTITEKLGGDITVSWKDGVIHFTVTL